MQAANTTQTQTQTTARPQLLDQATVDNARAGLELIINNIETVIVGKRDVVSLVALTLVAKGHVLFEDLPGTGKTTLVKSLAKSIDCRFNRLQLTPYVAPSDVTGASVFNQKTRSFEFHPGAVMSNLVLADGINRALAKTQSALLEAMEERQAMVDGKAYQLQEPFMVLATQNPIEQFGCSLSEAQADRFMVKLTMGYPAFEQEMHVLELGDRAKNALSSVVNGPNVLWLRDVAEAVYVSRLVIRYIVEIVTATRSNPEIQVGSSPRGGIALLALARAYALLMGRNYVSPDDVRLLAPYVLCHRISLAHEAKVSERTEQQVIESILSSIAVPAYDEQEIRGLL